MTWGWNARFDLPADVGGSIGTASEAKQTHSWPRYEAEYLKRALMSERYKYGTEGLDEQQKQVYLDRVVGDYKQEADECLKREFEDWLQGKHDANLAEEVYENCEGKPVRRWVFRTQEDLEGGYKVGQARAGWKHTPWGRAGLTHLPGVRDYLFDETRDAHRKDVEMQMLAEYGPQNLDQAWMYFKHWVKGRPLSDAVCLDPIAPKPGVRSDYGNALPERMYQYDPDPSDRQPGVVASDPNADDAAVAKPGSPNVLLTVDSEDANVQEMRALRMKMQDIVKGRARDPPYKPPHDDDAHRVAKDIREEHVAEDAQDRRLGHAAGPHSNLFS